MRIATPLIFGTLGELICERAGVLNLGIEGIFTIGALVGWMAVFQGLDLWTGVMLAALAGMLFGLLHGVLTVPLGLSQHVTGIAITLLASSLAYFTYRMVLPDSTTPPRIEAFQPLPIPLLSEIPLVGPASSPRRRSPICLHLHRPWPCAHALLGLVLRAVGENPAAVEAGDRRLPAAHRRRDGGQRLHGDRRRLLTMSAFNAFFEMVAGRGWICIALVVFASWKPGKALLGALLFGAFDAFQVRLQQQAGAGLPYQLFLMMPYLLSILALIVMSRRAAYPKALLVPYRKGERQ